MLAMTDCGAKTCNIVRCFNWPESIVRSIKENQSAVSASVNVYSWFTTGCAVSHTTQRNRLAIMWVIR